MISGIKNYAALSPVRALIILFCLTCIPVCSYSEQAPLKFFGSKPLKGDTIPYLEIQNKFVWNVKIISGNRTIKQFDKCKPDTAFNAVEKFDTAFLFTSFKAEPRLVNRIYTLNFYLTGSAKLEINKKSILESGVFCKDKESDLSKLKIDEFTYFYLNDTVINIKIVYVPHPEIKDFKLGLDIGSFGYEKEEISRKKIKVNEDYALGFFYFAFGIIFIILFLFFKVRSENLFFSLFCLFASLSFLTTPASSAASNQLSRYSLIFSIEFLSIFFAKVLLNQEKTKIPILIIFILSLISFHPCIFYAPDFSFFFWLGVFIFITLFLYAGISALYYLLQGFGQKKWEARTITYGSLIGLFFNILLPVVLSLIFQNKTKKMASILHYSADFGLCIYPLTVAIVLGRRNGQNQKQLIQQVKDIEKLSSENLEKEKEKKLILENQNIELEKKVHERTTEVVNQKNVIEIKNKEITDNLTYAKRIQSAILPDIDLIYKTLEQSFILYLPKDIVSGDFYAFAQKNDKVLIAAADCTGHGVAGAFMSMIGSALLNQIINEKNIVEPAAVLDQLHEEIIQSLKQKESESYDGMDISLCSFDLPAKTMNFSGANRPLWLIRNNELFIYKPNKFPIGDLRIMREEKFRQHQVMLQLQDTIYIFSDGYSDQFGGEKGKKLMSKKFKQLLLSIQNMSMREQENYLKDHFENWKKNNEQVDDVLVIGIRI